MSFVGGTVAPGWETVRTAFTDNFSGAEEVGAGLAVYHRGECVVDLTGGLREPGGAKAYDADTLQLVFSTTKGITAIALAMCVDRGLVRYTDKVSTHWPEFAAHGKGDATVAQLVSHQCGLYTVDGPITLAEALDWDTVTARLASTAPRWPIGTNHGYHALSYGWLAGEIVRRVDPQHRSLGTFVQEEIAAPLGVELWIGLPETKERRVAPLIGNAAPADPDVAAMIARFMGPGTPAGDALSLNGAFGEIGRQPAPGEQMVFNSRAVHAAEIPAANCITNAVSLAKVYAATMAPVDGVQLVSDATRDVARTQVTPADEPDACLLMMTTFGMGFMVSGPFSMFAGAGSYGHPGAGGSVAFAQPERELAVAYVMNKMTGNLAGDLRAQNCIDAAAKVADSLVV